MDPTDMSTPGNPVRAPSKCVHTGTAKLLDPNNKAAPELSSHQSIQLAEKKHILALQAAESARNTACTAPAETSAAASTSFLAPDNSFLTSRSQSPLQNAVQMRLLSETTLMQSHQL